MMGKVADDRSFSSPTDSLDRIKKKKRRKDLEDIRQNALAIKRQLRSKPSTNFAKPKTKLMKTLNQFASVRTEIEDANQTQGPLLNRHKAKKDEVVPQPLNINGFFRAGVKGKLLTRPISDASQKRLKNAVLQNNSLDLFQSGNYHQSSISHPKNQNTPVDSDIDIVLKLKADQILHPPSDGNSDIDSALLKENSKSSPVLGGSKRKKIVPTKSDAARTSSNNYSQRDQLLIKTMTQEEKINRQSFVQKQTHVNNKQIDSSKAEKDSLRDLRLSPGNPTPENVIFFSKRVPENNKGDKPKNKVEKLDKNPSDPQIIKFYVQTCKITNKSEVQTIRWDNLNFEDPMEMAKDSLKDTYAQGFAEYLKRQKNCRSNSRSRYTSTSSRSEIMEPDSAIARTVKKNTQFQGGETDTVQEDSDSCTNNSNDLGNDHTLDLDINKNQTKRKRTPSSKGCNSEIEFPSSIKANADPKSAKLIEKMNLIHPDKQELVARYLNDVNLSRLQENPRSLFKNKVKNDSEKEKILIDEHDETNLIQKSSKHIPSILRKSKSVLEDKTQSHVRKDYSSKKMMMNKTVCFSDNNFDNEHTPDYIISESVEAPNCKYEHINAKYQKPYKANLHRIDDISQRYFFSDSQNRSTGKNFDSHDIEISPISHPFALPEHNHSFHTRKLSQESINYRDNDYMNRSVSFGDIQERTNRLTLRSSQNCSEETELYSSQEDRRSTRSKHSKYYYQQPEPIAANHVAFIDYNEVPTPPIYKFPSNSSYDNQLYKVVNYQNKSPVLYKTDYHIDSPEDYLAVNRNLNVQYVPLQQRPARQPVKFIAVEGERIPQRLPIYSSNEGTSYSHTHKESNPQYVQTIKHGSVYKVPFIPRQKQRIPQTITSSSHDRNQYRQVEKINTHHRSSDIDESSGMVNNPANYVPSSSSRQGRIPQQSIPIRSTDNKILVDQGRLVEVLSPVYSQVEYDHAPRIIHESCQRATVYFQSVPQNIRVKRP